MDKRHYRNLSSEEKDEVIEQLLELLDIEIYDPYEWGPPGIKLQKKNDVDPHNHYEHYED